MERSFYEEAEEMNYIINKDILKKKNIQIDRK